MVPHQRHRQPPRSLPGASRRDPAAAGTVPRRRDRSAPRRAKSCGRTFAASWDGRSPSSAASGCARETSPAPTKRCSPPIRPDGTRNPASPWCALLAATSPPRRPRSATRSSGRHGSRRRSCHRPPSCDARRCSTCTVEIAIADGDVDAAQAAADELAAIAIRFPEQGARRVGRARPGAGATRRGRLPARRNSSSPKPPICGTRSVRPTRQRSPASASATPAAPVATSSAPNSSTAPPERSSTRSARHPQRPAPPSSHVAAGAQSDLANNAFRRVGDYWSVTFEGRTVNLPDRKGMRHLSRLLAQPGREFHVLDLAATEAGNPVPADDDAAATHLAFGDAGEMLDARAKSAYRRRLAEIDDDIEQARAQRRPHPRGASRRRTRLPHPRAVTRRGPRWPRPTSRVGVRARPIRDHTGDPPSDRPDPTSTTPNSDSTSNAPSAPAPTAPTSQTPARPTAGNSDDSQDT